MTKATQTSPADFTPTKGMFVVAERGDRQYAADRLGLQLVVISPVLGFVVQCLPQTQHGGVRWPISTFQDSAL